jgi:hypothetical protein
MEMAQAMKIGGHPTSSNLLDWLISDRGEALMMEMSQNLKVGGHPTSSNLHDWLISRQR